VSALFSIIHIFICIILIIAVLLQSGKAADLAGAFGGVGSQTAFGPRGAATLLHKITTICAVLFMITSLGLWLFTSGGESKSAMKGEKGGPLREQTPAAETTKKEQPSPATQPAGTTTQQEQPPATGQQKETSKETKK